MIILFTIIGWTLLIWGVGTIITNYFIAFNWLIFKKNSSLIPLLGMICTSIGLFLILNQSYYWFITLSLLDPSIVSIVIFLFSHLYKKYCKNN
jgi:hypothetical protein